MRRQWPTPTSMGEDVEDFIEVNAKNSCLSLFEMKDLDLSIFAFVVLKHMM
jgi:hypothetical protein